MNYLPTHAAARMPLKRDTEWKKQGTESEILSNFKIIWFSGKGKTIGREIRSVIARGLGYKIRTDNKGKSGNFSGTGKYSKFWLGYTMIYACQNWTKHTPKKKDFLQSGQIYLSLKIKWI